RPPRPPLFPYTTLFRSAAATAEFLPDVEADTDTDTDESAEESFAFREGGGDTFNLATLKEMSISKLTQIAKDLDVPGATGMRKRSEEHTSELQSRENLV